MSISIDETHDPARTSWLASANGHGEFPIQNLPFGIFSPDGGARRAGVAIGDGIIDLRGLASAGLLMCATDLIQQPSGIPVRRPHGQSKPPDSDLPILGPSRRVDYELELGLWVGQGNTLGEPIPISEAWEHIVGVCLLNDRSARDIQSWEYQPLGPFLAKNFHTTISPWVVTAEALAPFRQMVSPRSEHDPAPLGYLTHPEDHEYGGLSLELHVSLLSPLMREQGMAPYCVSSGDTSGMYWTLAQMIAHQQPLRRRPLGHGHVIHSSA